MTGDRPTTRSARRPFSVVEIIVVVAIMALIMAVAVMSIQKIPSPLSLDQAVQGVGKVFEEASTQALVQGKGSVVTYDPENKSFSVSAMPPANTDEDSEYSSKSIEDVLVRHGEAPDISSFAIEEPPPEDMTGMGLLAYTIPEEMDVEVNDPMKNNPQAEQRKARKSGAEEEEQRVKFFFFPDGTGSGPDLLLSFKGHKVIIGISPLTGLFQSAEVEDEGY